ncbi:hypothetical protein [Myxococcus landrumensis]|uniref:hypothetical protein n=1 Tax=Myxococcus landrumensis TaxID=2813577 RepID=UPI001F512323|nr:hypothetical protein [Myxococcus landrumus]
MVLVYGLAVAPVLHAVVGHSGGTRHVHSHGGKAHSHGTREEAADGLAPESARKSSGTRSEGHGPDGHKHLTGSVEHLSALATTWVMVHVTGVYWVSWVTEAARGPTRAPGTAPRRTAMPQGP